MISVNQGIGTSIPELFKGEAWDHGGHHVEGEN